MEKADNKKIKLWTPTFIALCWINFGIALPLYLLMVILTPFCMGTYGVSYSAGGASITVFVVATLVTRFFFGGKIDDWGVKRMLTIGLALNFISCFSFVFPMPFWLLLLFRFVQGVGFAFGTGSSAAAAAMVLPEARRAEGIGYFSMMQAFATGIGPFVAVFLNNITGSYQTLFITTAIISALAFASIGVLRVDSPGEEKVPLPAKAQEKNERKGLSRFIHLSILLWAPALLFVYMGYSGVVSFVVSFAGENGLQDAVSVYFVLYALAILLTRPPIGKHVDKHGEKPIVYLTFASLAIGLAVLAFSFNGFMLLVSAVLIGFGIGALQSILQAVIARDTPTSDLGRANSTFMMSIDLGVGVGPVVIGAFIPFTGFSFCYLALAIGAVIACVLYYFLDKRRVRSKAK